MLSGTVRVGALGSNGDCLYYVRLCSETFGGGDVDDRWTNSLPLASFQRAYDARYTLSSSGIGLSNVSPSHAAILQWTPALVDAQRFLTEP